MGTQLIESPHIENISKSSKVNPIKLIPQPGQSLEDILYCKKIINYNLKCIEKKEPFFEFIRQGIKKKSPEYAFRHFLGHQGVKSIFSIKGLNKNLIDKLQEPHIIAYTHKNHEESILIPIFSDLITGKKLWQIGSRKVANMLKFWLNIFGLIPRSDGGIYKLIKKASQGENIAIAPEGDLNRGLSIIKFHTGLSRIKIALETMYQKDVPILLIETKGHLYSNNISDKLKEKKTIKKLLREPANEEWQISKNGGRYRTGTCFEIGPLIYNEDLIDETKGRINLIKEFKENILPQLKKIWPDVKDNKFPIFFKNLENIDMPQKLKKQIKENAENIANKIGITFSKFTGREYDTQSRIGKYRSFRKCIIKKVSANLENIKKTYEFNKNLSKKENLKLYSEFKKINLNNYVNLFAQNEINTIHTATIENKIIANCLSKDSPESLFIWLMNVDEKYRKSGICSGFLDLLKEHIYNSHSANRNYKPITIIIPHENETARCIAAHKKFKPKRIINEHETLYEYKIPEEDIFTNLISKITGYDNCKVLYI